MLHTKAFSAMWKDSGAAMLKPDLELAGIEYQTEDGVADSHSLRHTFGTLLARSGVSPQDAQKLMRHSDINLTMGIYTHLRLSDKVDANGPNWPHHQIAEAFLCHLRTVSNVCKSLVERGFEITLNGKKRDTPPRKRLN